MLTMRATNFGTGVEIFGDYHDLNFFHSQLHEIAGNDERMPGYWTLINMAYEVRHAFQEDRLKEDFGFVDLPIQYFGFKYYWIDILLVLNSLREGCAFLPTNKATQSLVYRFEFLVEDTVSKYDVQFLDDFFRCMNLLKLNEGRYTHLFRTKVLWELLQQPNGKRRFRSLKKEMEIFNPFSDYHKSFKGLLDKEAIRLNCEIEDLEPNYPFQNLKYKW